MRTAQQLYDEVVNHLRQQNDISVTITGVCQYRGPNGLKCAIGKLIPDENYLPIMENKNITALLDCGLLPFMLQQELEVNKRLLAALQRAHDYGDISQWEDDFEKIAELFSLQYTPKQQAGEVT